MAGQVCKMLNKIVDARSNGNRALVIVTKTKMILKGVDPDKFGPTTPDDPEVIKRVREIASEMGVLV
jgi:hypothetical protein